MREAVFGLRTVSSGAAALCMHPLQKLQVYAEAQHLAHACCDSALAISDRDLRWQLMRASRSIAANLAEGTGCPSQAAFARYIAIALASAKETECHLAFARQAGMLSPAHHEQLLQMLNRLAPRLVRLLAAVRRNASRRIKPDA